MKRSFYKKLILPLITIALISGCKKDNSSEGFVPKYDSDTEFSVSIVGNYANFESLEAEIERFSEYYPNANVEFTFLDNYNKTIQTTLSSDDQPDIYFTMLWMKGRSEYEIIFDKAENLSDPSLNIDTSCIRQDLCWTNDSGDLIEIPIFTTSYGMLVNTDIFDKEGLEIPSTYTELMEVCAALQKSGYESPIMGYNGQSTSAGLFHTYAYPMYCYDVMNNPDSLQDLNNLVSSAGEIMRPTLQRFYDFINSGYIDIDKCTDEIENSYDAVIMRFFEGDVPMMLCTGDVISGTAKRESKSDAFTANPFDYKFYTVPVTDDGGFFLNAVTVAFSVNKDSANLDYANEFMRFITSEEELGNMSELKRLITPTNNFTLDKVYQSLADVPEERRISKTKLGLLDVAVIEFRTALYKVSTGELTIDEAVSLYGQLQEN